MKILSIIWSLVIITMTSVAMTTALDMAAVQVSPLVPAGILTGINLATGIFNVNMGPGILMFNVGHILRLDSKSNPSGLTTLAYWAYIAEIDNFPQLAASPTTAATRMTLESTTGFTFLATKAFRKLSIVLEGGKVDSEPIGEHDGQNYLNKATLKVAGTSAEILALAAELKNSHTAWLLKEQSGDIRVLGSPDFPATAKCTLTSGQGKEDFRGLTIELEAASPDPAYLYTGDIDDDPSS